MCETFYTITQSKSNIPVRDHKMVGGQACLCSKEKFGGSKMAEVLIEFSSRTFGVVSFGPVISSSGLSEHEVVRSEDLTKGARPHAVHGAGLQINQHGLKFKIQLQFLLVFFSNKWRLFG